MSGRIRRLLQIFLWLCFTRILQPGPVAFCTRCCSSFPFPGKASVCAGPAAASQLYLLFQGRLLWLGKLPPHTPFSFSSTTSSHNDWFTHLLISGLYGLLWLHLLHQLGYVSCFFPWGWTRHNLWILIVSPQHLERRGKQGWARKRQAEKDERIWRWEVFTPGMKVAPGWPKAEQFTLFCNMQNGPAPALRSKHFEGAWGAPYLYFYKLLGLLWVLGYIPIASIWPSLKWGSVLWR